MILFSTAGLKTFGVCRIVHRMEVKSRFLRRKTYRTGRMMNCLTISTAFRHGNYLGVQDRLVVVCLKIVLFCCEC